MTVHRSPTRRPITALEVPVLSAAHRLRSSAEFAATVRRGRRASCGALSVHLLRTPDAAPARAGLVVGKAVGGSVVRHQVSRRLRHVLRPEVELLPAGTLLVVRAAPRAAQASSQELAADLGVSLRAVTGAGRGPGTAADPVTAR